MVKNNLSFLPTESFWISLGGCNRLCLIFEYTNNVAHIPTTPIITIMLPNIKLGTRVIWQAIA